MHEPSRHETDRMYRGGPNEATRRIVPLIPWPKPPRQQPTVEEQRAAGRTGGGPECPGCHGRNLYRLPHDDRLQCRDCFLGWVVVVDPEKGIRLDQVQLPTPAPVA